jgi:aminoglycoside 6'-N-acetyltransferase I
MKILDAIPQHAAAMAQMLVEGFARLAPEAWPTIEAALDEVTEAFELERVCRVAVDGDEVTGWIGGIPLYGGNVYELHPLVVRADRQRRGIGRALVADLERIVAARGAHTLTLGSDDEVGLTSIGGVDLYPDPLRHLAALEDQGGHPLTFYRACGFVVTGVMPDANGPGKPDIFMAKRVER